MFLFLYIIRTATYQKMRTFHSAVVLYSRILNFYKKKFIFHIKLLRHFEFVRIKISIKVYLYPKYKKTKEKWIKISTLKILGEKYKVFRRHLEYRRHFDFSGLASNFLQWNSASSITYPKIRTFHSTTKKS
jgi:hypothetical protein